MRKAHAGAVVMACAALAGCSSAAPDCGADAVKKTLATMTRDRAMQVVADSFAPPRGPGKLALAASTRISIETPRLVLWEKDAGRLNCVADVVVAAPVGARASVVTVRTELNYRVMGGHGDAFFVEIAYADLMNVLPVRPVATRRAGSER